MPHRLAALRQALRLRLLASPVVAATLRILADAPRRRPDDRMELAFITPPTSSPGWILEAICRELGARLASGRTFYIPSGAPLPPAERYFFSHYMYYVGALNAFGPLRRGRNYVFATHLEGDKHGISNDLLARLLDRSDGVICMNSALRGQLLGYGVSPDKLSVVVGAADRELFRPHARQPDGSVGLCSAYYERKSPGLMLEIVRRLRHRRFVLLGQGWHRYPRFAELSALPNFKYVEAPYAEYPQHYRDMSVFVSVSQLEGGPIPLLEAMMSNAVPVASRTGFAPDVIEHGRNGYLFDVGADAASVCELIEAAYGLEFDVHSTVRHCDWRPFADAIGARIGLPPRRPTQVAPDLAATAAERP